MSAYPLSRKQWRIHDIFLKFSTQRHRPRDKGLIDETPDFQVRAARAKEEARGSFFFFLFFLLLFKTCMYARVICACSLTSTLRLRFLSSSSSSCLSAEDRQTRLHGKRVTRVTFQSQLRKKCRSLLEINCSQDETALCCAVLALSGTDTLVSLIPRPIPGHQRLDDRRSPLGASQHKKEKNSCRPSPEERQLGRQFMR